MRYLVTGGAGFIGSNFVKHLIRNNEKIVVLDSLTYAGNLENLYPFLNEKNLIIPQQHWRLTPARYSINHDVIVDPKYTVEHRRLKSKLKGMEPKPVAAEDISNAVADACLNEQLVFIYGSIVDPDIVKVVVNQSDFIVHFAAETHVDRSILDPSEFIKTDVYGTYILLEAARKHEQLKKFIHISTDEVYGVATGRSFSESDPINPRNPYSASKAAADRLVFAYNQTYELPVNIARPSNNFGPYQYPEKLIPVMIIKAIRNESLPLYGDGQQIRDWLFVEDTVRAVDLIIKKGTNGEVYNIAGNNERENIEVVRFILRKLSKPETLIDFVKDRPGHDRRYSLDDTKLTQELGFYHTGIFEEQLSRTIQWYVENQQWWETIIKKDKEYQEFMEQWYRR